MARTPFGSNLVITDVAVENPRFAGKKSHKLFAQMVSFMDKHPKATVAELIAKTGYRRQDFLWDQARGDVIAKKVATKH
jgi:hypothetical protein